MKNKFIILIFSFIITGYLALAAKTPKKFKDTVVLKNGTVINGIRATDSILVTTEDGATTIYKKKDVSEVKKSGINKESNVESSANKENKEENQIVKKERSLGIESWSDYKGVMQWEDAKTLCANLGMRLPTIGELRAAFIEGTTESWKKDGLFYWSSTPGELDHSYNIGISNGHFFIDDRSFVNDVRCVR